MRKVIIQLQAKQIFLKWNQIYGNLSDFLFIIQPILLQFLIALNGSSRDIPYVNVFLTLEILFLINHFSNDF